MTEETQTQFKTEGQPAFPVASTENDNSATSSTEKTSTEQTQSQEGEQTTADTKDANAKTEETNFADHPRWKEREEDWTKRFNDQEKRHLEEVTQSIAKLRAEFMGSVKGTPNTDQVEVPAWFGGDEDQFREFLKWNDQQVIAKARELTVKDIETRSTAEQQKIDEATKYMNDQLVALESDKTVNPQGQQIDRNKILKFVLDNELVDTKGRWNYKAAFKMMGATNVFAAKNAINEKKAVASASTSENRAETKPQAFMTNKDFSKPENRPW